MSQGNGSDEERIVGRMNCVCLTAYKAPEMLSELLTAVQDDFLCYVHIDKSSDVLFDEVRGRHPKVRFYSAYQVSWGGYQHLEAILLLLNEAMKEPWEYVHIISGEDYPIVSNKAIYARLDGDTHSYACYQLAMDKTHSANKRYRYYWPYTRFAWNYKNQWIRWINLAAIACQYPFVNRKCIGEIEKVYWGFIWGDYHRSAVNCVLQYLKAHDAFMRDLQWCKIPEELTFQSILMNDSEQQSLLENRILRFWNWSRGDNSGPPYLMIDDMDELGKSDALFARKVRADSEVLNRIRQLRRE